MTPLPSSPTTDTLARIVAHTWQHLPQWQAKLPLKAIESRCAQLLPRPSWLELWQAHAPGPKLILELKPASPSQGVLQANLAHNPEALAQRVAAYAQVAHGLSVLTNEAFFGGSFELLAQVAALTANTPRPLPLLAKDIIVHPWQVAQAKLAGAHACLLIVRALPKAMLVDLVTYATHLGLTPIVEVHTDDELGQAVEVNPPVLLINNRNLSSLAMHPDTVAQLAPLCPTGVPLIAASGYQQVADLQVAWQHADACLVGTHLMTLPPHELTDWLTQCKQAMTAST
jgi:indole-3-glycerol phosphate synthase